MTDLVTFFSLAAMLLSFIGNILVIKKKKSGYIAWTIGNIFWIIYVFIGVFNIGLLIQNIVYIALNAYGFIKWWKQELH